MAPANIHQLHDLENSLSVEWTISSCLTLETFKDNRLGNNLKTELPRKRGFQENRMNKC